MRNFLSILFLVLSFNLYSQKKDKLTVVIDDDNYVYKNEWSIGMRIHTNGMSAFYERVWIKSIWKKNVLQTNFFYFKDFKQKKVKSDYAAIYNTGGYFFGKQNNFWNVNVLYGQKKIIAEKADQNGVRFSMVYLGGISLGILKPYGLSIVESDNFSLNPPETEVYFYDENNPEVFLSPSNTNTRIFGPAGLRHGFGGMKFIPGAHIKFGFNFDWSNRDAFIKSIEIGSQLDIYYKKLPVMITSRNKPYIFNLYLSFQMGKRW